MTLSAWVALISAALKFPDSVMSLVRALQDTPEEKHQDLMRAIQAESDKFKREGRPTWDS